MEYFWLALTVVILLGFVVIWRATHQNGWLSSLLAASVTLGNVPFLPGSQALSGSAKMGVAIVRGVILASALTVLIVTRVRLRRRAPEPRG